MTKFHPNNERDTRNQISNRSNVDRATPNSPSWLGHGGPRAYTIDHLLVLGASMDELVTMSGSANEGSVRAHFNHLQKEHRLPIARNDRGEYFFAFPEK